MTFFAEMGGLPPALRMKELEEAHGRDIQDAVDQIRQAKEQRVALLWRASSQVRLWLRLQGFIVVEERLYEVCDCKEKPPRFPLLCTHWHIGCNVYW